ncbi:sodium:solute symporter family protein [Pseudotabrizicola sp. 4114]|uniref:sodium:solute symporter family protein n=1 Tax=Pseudotabrizicola sp. 4114 TaxID=2817731 RepID=UPI0032B83178
MTYLILAAFLGGLVLVSYQSRRSGPTGGSEAENFLLGGRSIGTILLLLSMGATYFSTWTLLGALGSYFRSGVWFAGFTVWTIFHAIFIWLFGVRIWLAGKKYGFVTPAQMIEDYYSSRRLRLVVAIVGIFALVPVMLIQITGAAMALESLTNGALPYWAGVIIMSAFVSFIVLWAGFRGTAWSDALMGVLFAAVMIGSCIFVFSIAGGTNLFREASKVAPELLVNRGNPMQMLDLWLSIGFGAWVLPHMWQKFYSASSAEALGKVMLATPFWNSWMMAFIPLVIGIAAVIPGVVPGLTTQTSDTILPQLFAHHTPMLGALVVAGILAAAISTVNSQLLSSASLVAYDLIGVFHGKDPSPHRITVITRVVVVVLTACLLVLGLTSVGKGFLVPVAALGFGLGLQLVPSALGALHLRGITEQGAFWGMVIGTVAMVALKLYPDLVPLSPAIGGLAVNGLVTAILSAFTPKVSAQSYERYHGLYREYFSNEQSSHADLQVRRAQA